MTGNVAVFTEDERTAVEAAASVAVEFLVPMGRDDDVRVVRAAAVCGPGQAILDRACEVMAGLHLRCVAQSARDFWLGEFDAREVDDPFGMVADLAATREAQANQLAAGIAVLTHARVTATVR